MGQFKPMVKMETTEPSVELKLKKGGRVAKKADGGMMGSPMSAAGPMPALPPPMPARGGMMGAKAPMRPPLAMRRRAMRGMPAGPGPAGPIGGAAQMQASMPPPMPSAPMKKGGKADMGQDKAMVKKAFKQHDMQEHKGGKGTSLKLKHGGKMATGGVVNGQGGFATGGVVNGQGGYATGGVAKSNGGGYKAGGKAMMGGGMAGEGMMGGGMMDDGMMNEGMSGAYKKGGATKKAYAAGGTVNSGRPVAMPQGNKKPSQPVSTNLVAGTFKKGGKVTPAQGRLQKMSASENAPAFRAAKADSNEKYGPASRMKRAEGGDVDLSKGLYDKAFGPDEDDLEMAKTIRSIPRKMFDGVKSLMGQGSVTEAERKAMMSPKMPAQGSVTEAERKAMLNATKPSGSVTKTKESVTLSPAGKKRGGMAC